MTVKLATTIYSNIGCGLRSVVKLLGIINDTFGGILGDGLPSHTTISDWMQKAGLATYMESGERFSDGEYCDILDESITVGKQKLLVTLGAPAMPQGHPLRHEDVEVIGMAVAPSWNGDAVEEEIKKRAAKVGHDPSYIISDNGPNLAKGVRQTGITHHRDIGHSIGLVLEEVYKGQEDFENFTQKMNGIRTKYHLTEMAYLLPPKQRAIARFMNLFEWVDWAESLLQAYPSLKEEERQAFSFVPENRALVDELARIMQYVRLVEQKCKRDGISRETAKLCAWAARGLISGECATRRTIAVGAKIGLFLLEEAEKVGKDGIAHNISSDIIESTFGWFKMRKPTNKLCGVTASVVSIALLGKLASKDKVDKFDFKAKMEAVRLGDVKEWKSLNLLDNWVTTRKITLRKIGAVHFLRGWQGWPGLTEYLVQTIRISKKVSTFAPWMTKVCFSSIR